MNRRTRTPSLERLRNVNFYYIFRVQNEAYIGEYRLRLFSNWLHRGCEFIFEAVSYQTLYIIFNILSTYAPIRTHTDFCKDCLHNMNV